MAEPTRAARVRRQTELPGEFARGRYAAGVQDPVMPGDEGALDLALLGRREGFRADRPPSAGRRREGPPRNRRDRREGGPASRNGR